MAGTDNVKWTSNDLPRHANEYVNKVVIYLVSLMCTAQQILSMKYKVGCGALGHISKL